MEILIVVAIWTVVVKRGVEDILHTARGGTPHRYAAAKARRQSGAAGRYWGALRDDTFEGMLRRHNERVARHAAGRPTSKVARPRGAATQFFAGLFQDGRRAARRSWDDRWTRLDEKRRERSTRPRPDQETVPGEIVPNVLDDEPPMYVKDGRDWGNCDTCGKRMVLLPYQSTCAWCTYERFGGASNPDAGRLTADEAKRWTRGPAPRQDEDRAEDGPQDEDQDRPQDEDQDRPEPSVVPDEDDSPTPVPQDEPTDPTHPEQQDDEPSGPDQTSPLASTTTQEGPTTMTATTTEVVGLDSAIRFCEDSARAYRAQMQAIEQTQAALAAGDVTGPAADTFAQAMEQSNLAAASMDAAAAELLSHKQVQEAYLANQGAGTRDFILAGQ